MHLLLYRAVCQSGFKVGDDTRDLLGGCRGPYQAQVFAEKHAAVMFEHALARSVPASMTGYGRTTQNPNLMVSVSTITQALHFAFSMSRLLWRARAPSSRGLPSSSHFSLSETAIRHSQLAAEVDL
jgi:hypothetical protein